MSGKIINDKSLEIISKSITNMMSLSLISFQTKDERKAYQRAFDNISDMLKIISVHVEYDKLIENYSVASLAIEKSANLISYLGNNVLLKPNDGVDQPVGPEVGNGVGQQVGKEYFGA